MRMQPSRKMLQYRIRNLDDEIRWMDFSYTVGVRPIMCFYSLDAFWIFVEYPGKTFAAIEKPNKGRYHTYTFSNDTRLMGYDAMSDKIWFVYDTSIAGIKTSKLYKE